MEKKNQIRIAVTATATGETYDYVKSAVVPPGQLWCLQHIAYENQTGARGTFRRYIESRNQNIMLGELQGPGAAELITADGDLWLGEGERLTVRQATCTAADVLALYATGYIVYLDEVT